MSLHQNPLKYVHLYLNYGLCISALFVSKSALRHVYLESFVSVCLVSILTYMDGFSRDLRLVLEQRECIGGQLLWLAADS